MENYTVVIPAAGQGKRMQAGKNKQFLMLDNTPLVIHTLRVFDTDPACREIVLVVNDQETEAMQDLIATYKITKTIQVIPGGKERQDSVREGLKQIDGDEGTMVLIHDGARPFVSRKRISELTAKAAESGAAVLGVPVKDTVKKAEEGVVAETVDRTSLWAVQTPQAFQLPLILRAHEKAQAEGFAGTDDASLAEWQGEEVRIVEGDYSNIKLTTPEDMLFAEAIISQRKDGQRQ
ncbi:2-C-methyl-D-erythritol 4-phosphate cytidylyltransferase [Alteribacter natronophilus]|uniref:2-C-methyl-D-erythritol 4-phosphate cytidylyltransferase n=1 Tax=Alteribacter natronophilus TaxID=2583810 RepID=UPI00110DDDFA|nr:2-C-methyl-D-erythritol 4-phosphate cytidylyltransferase [Alteribacter natronophilus]TMW70002.1 2-C-methyl-D-erythritol 4-phosphate cytidylyltransferase [Alteribacter natronophilus]